MPPKAARKRTRKGDAAAAPSQPAAPHQAQAAPVQRDGSDDQTAKRQRKGDEHKSDEPAEAAAASEAAGAVQPPPAESAAAASAAPTAASANLNGHSATAAASATTAVIPLSDAPECPVCFESYECEEPKAGNGESRIPRTLQCSHPACSSCLLKQLTLTPGRMKCPTCGDERPLLAGMAAAAVSSPAAWLRCIPQSSAIIEAVRRSQQLEAQLQQAQSKQQRCSYPTCVAAAVKWCEECCSEMCEGHDSSWHSGSRSAHKRLPLADRAAVRQERMAAALTAEANRLRAGIQSAVQQREQTLAIQANAIASMRREHAHSEEHLRVESARQMAQLQAYHSGLQKEAEAKLAVEQVSLSQLREISQRTNGMAAAEVLAQEAVFGALLATIRPSIRPPGDGGLLGRTKLSDGLFERLQRFLGASVCLPRAQLLYRATRDGFKAGDLWIRCAAKGPTLTTVKVAGNGFICGAYTSVSWPADAATTDQPRFLPDPSDRTFLFSLVNAHGRPAKLRLKGGESGRAIHVKGSGYGPGFGGGADLRLMWGQQSANHAIGCFVHPRSFEIDQDAEAAADLQPIRFAYDKTLLAGDDGTGGVGVSFAAEEIEVYLL